MGTRLFLQYLWENLRWSIGRSGDADSALSVMRAVLAMALAGLSVFGANAEWIENSVVQVILTSAPLAIYLFFVAPFVLWRKERQRAEKLEELMASPRRRLNIEVEVGGEPGGRSYLFVPETISYRSRDESRNGSLAYLPHIKVTNREEYTVTLVPKLVIELAEEYEPRSPLVLEPETPFPARSITEESLGFMETQSMLDRQELDHGKDCGNRITLSPNTGDHFRLAYLIEEEFWETFDDGWPMAFMNWHLSINESGATNRPPIEVRIPGTFP